MKNFIFDLWMLALAFCALVTALIGLRTKRWLSAVVFGFSAPLTLIWLVVAIALAAMYWREFVYGPFAGFIGAAVALFALAAFLSGRALFTTTQASWAITASGLIALILGHAINNILLGLMSGEV